MLTSTLPDLEEAEAGGDRWEAGPTEARWWSAAAFGRILSVR
jgi:hypothetical protein